MKIRCDFVSNSSSCSFIVENAMPAIEIFKKFEKYDVPYSLDETEFILCGPYDKLKKIIDVLEISDENCIWQSAYDGMYSLTIPFSSLITLDVGLLDDLKLTVYASDMRDESNSVFVKLLANVLMNAGVDVENTGECSFDLFESRSIIAALFKELFMRR